MQKQKLLFLGAVVIFLLAYLFLFISVPDAHASLKDVACIAVGSPNDSQPCVDVGVPPLLFSAAQLEYGTAITPIIHQDILGKKLVIPKRDSINIIYFFDIKNQFHVNTIQNIHFLEKDIEAHEKGEINTFLVSKGKKKEFVDILKKYDNQLTLINDSKNKLFEKYSYSCKLCQLIVVVDSSLTLVYVSSQLDLRFLREIIERSFR